MESKKTSSDEWIKMKTAIRSRMSIEGIKKFQPELVKRITNKNGKNLLHVSTKRGKLDSTEYLIKIGCNINQKDSKDGCTPLRLAFTRPGNHKISRLLLDSGADYSWENIGKESSTIRFSNEKTICTIRGFLRKECREAPAKPLVSKGWSLDAIACLQNDEITMNAVKLMGLEDVYKELVNTIKDLDNNDHCDLQYIEGLLQQLSKHKILISMLLLEAVKIQNPKSTLIIKLLLFYGASPKGFGRKQLEPLLITLITNKFRNAWTLMDYGAELEDLNLDSLSCLWKVKKTLNSLPHVSSEENSTILDESLFLLEHEWDLKKKFTKKMSELYNCIIENYFENIQDKQKSDIGFPLAKWTERLRHCGFDDVKLQQMKFFFMVHELNKFPLYDSQKFLEDIEECNKEIETMHEFKVNDTLSVYDIFTKSVYELIIYTRNETFMEEVQSILNSFNFKIYHDTLCFKVNKACEKKILLDSSINILSTCLPKKVGCYDILKKIVFYLGVPNYLC